MGTLDVKCAVKQRFEAARSPRETSPSNANDPRGALKGQKKWNT